MERNNFAWLIFILLITGGGIWLVLNDNFPIRQGLDLQGGLQVLLEADVPEDQDVTRDTMNTVRQIIDQRVNAIGVTEPIVQVEGDRRVLIELPGIDNPEDALSLIQETALLEFVDTGSQPLFEGQCIRTDLNDGQPSPCELTEGITVEQAQANPAPTYDTLLTGAALRTANSETDGLSNFFVSFVMQPDAAQIFEDYTRDNVGNFLTIVLDKRVISSPQIQSVIPGEGSITGNFTLEEAQRLSTQLRFGSLPVPMRIESTRQIGATLGEVSVAASIRAGAIGLVVVLLFMIIYYRLPGFLASLALVIYALLNVAVFKGLSVTLTLPAIAGFLLSTGMAVDANILVFERLKEELRRGESLSNSIIVGFSRAWSSIRDSNVATLVICFILWSFGRSFGASSVQGFAITLSIGVLISMFTAVIVTRTFVNLVLGNAGKAIREQKWLLGA